MKQIFGLLALCLCTPGSYALTAAQRVWIALESPYLIDDGYATGVVLDLSGTHAEVEVRQLEERGERTLYGSCRGGLAMPYTEPTQSATAGNTYVEQVPLELVSTWRDGQHRFLQREMLGVRFQRWVDQAPGLNPYSLDDAISVAKKYATQRDADAFEMMAIMRRARAPQGFITPLDQRLDLLENAGEKLTALALLHPQVLREAIREKSPQQLLGRTLAQVFERLVTDYHALDEQQNPDLKESLATMLHLWATGGGEWQAPVELQLRLPFLRAG